MTLCIAMSGALLALAVDSFTLEWTHSVTRSHWWERWEVIPDGLRPVEARITGSGPGMDPPEGARLIDGTWSYAPDLPPQREVFLAASGMTGGGWTLCAAGQCYLLGAKADRPLRLWQAAQCRPDRGANP